MKPIISKNIRVRNPDNFNVGEYSIIDDFCYFSTKVDIGKCSHIASGCSIAGGKERLFVLGDFSSISSGVKIWCTSDDFVNDLVTLLPEKVRNFKGHIITGDVVIDNYTAIGSNSVVMPKNHIPEGTAIGALSFVPAGYKFFPWSVYAGIPIRLIKSRNRKNVLAQAAQLRKYFKSLIAK